MKISARNTLVGKIVEIHEGPVSTEVTIETAAGEKIVSSITTTSAKNRVRRKPWRSHRRPPDWS